MLKINFGLSQTSKFTILLFILLILIGCGKIFEEKLIEYDSDEGRFSVSMPGEPDKQTEEISIGIGTIELHMYMVEKSNIVYMVAFSDYPDEIIDAAEPDELLDAAKNGAIQNINGKITEEEAITYGEDPGIEIQFSAKGGKGKGQAVIVLSGNRLYQVLAVGSNFTYPDKTVKRFLESFTIW